MGTTHVGFSYPQAPTVGSQIEFKADSVSGRGIKLYVEFDDGEKCYIGFQDNGHAVEDACSEPSSKQNVLRWG